MNPYQLVLRNDKGSVLTHTELDNNFKHFLYAFSGATTSRSMNLVSSATLSTLTGFTRNATLLDTNNIVSGDVFVVPAGVTYAKATANMYYADIDSLFLSGESTVDMAIYITKNGDVVGLDVKYGLPTGNDQAGIITIPPYVMEVASGDVFAVFVTQHNTENATLPISGIFAIELLR